MLLRKALSLNGDITVPGDKSISHRAVMFGALSEGMTEIHHFLNSADCIATMECFKEMGIMFTEKKEEDVLLIYGKGFHGLSQPSRTLDVGNSGTAIRLLTGILSGQNFSSDITGDASIERRPMDRVLTPLSQMNASVRSISKNGCAPLHLEPSHLNGIQYLSPVASAQVKSSILFAGLYAQGATEVTEPCLSRNHTEVMMKSFGIPVDVRGNTVSIQPVPAISGRKIIVPGDISSAAYFIAAGLLAENSCIRIRGVGINPTRDGILEVCRQMGANLVLEHDSEIGGERSADIIVKSSTLHGTIIEGSIIPRLIDELPIIALMACFAEGKTIIRDAQELKVKESNRIEHITKNLLLLGADVTATDDGFIINGGRPLRGAVIDPAFDHRIAMTFAVAGLLIDGETTILHPEYTNISYPEFQRDLRNLAIF